MGLRDAIVRRFALGWLKDKVNGVRAGKESGMKQALKFLDGLKFIIGFLVFLGLGVWDNYHGTHYRDAAGSFLAVFGWEWGSAEATKAAGPLIMLIGIGFQVYKANQQLRAGAPVSSLLTTEAYVIQHEVDLAKGKPAAMATEAKAAAVVAEAPKP